MGENGIKVKSGLIRSFSSKEYKKELYFPLGISVSIGDTGFFLKSRFHKHIGIYLSDVVRFTHPDKEIKNLILAGYFSDKMYDRIISEQLFPVYHLMEDEIEAIRRIFEIKGKDYSETVTREILEKDFERYTTEISEVFDRYIKNAYREELQRLFLASIDKEEEKELFRMTNYLIHFINWDGSFYSFYDSSLEIISGVIREIEKHIRPDLLTSIKAYRAYHSHMNMLERFFDKREKGKISVLSLLDWHSDIKSMLTEQFASIFGHARGDEYISCLDDILKTETEG